MTKTLSDKRIELQDEEANWVIVIPEEDVKQFIKDLKEEFKKRSWKAWSWRDIEIVIDKLAGDKLI